MALGNNSSTRPPVTYVSLGRGEKVGFHHQLGRDDHGEKIVNVYEYVSGVPVGIYLKEELNYEVAKALRDKGINPNAVKTDDYKKDDKHWTANVLFRDPEDSQVVGVKIDLTDSLGGKVVGMLNTLRMENRLGECVKLRTFYAPPHSKYNDKDKGRESINMAPFDPADPQTKHEDIKPVYLDAEGNMMLNEDGTPKPLPMGVVIATIKGKDHWDFSARNDLILETAVSVFEHFEQQKAANKHAQSHHEGAGGDDGVDLNEAAAAAMPGQAA